MADEKANQPLKTFNVNRTAEAVQEIEVQASSESEAIEKALETWNTKNNNWTLNPLTVSKPIISYHDWYFIEFKTLKSAKEYVEEFGNCEIFPVIGFKELSINGKWDFDGSSVRFQRGGTVLVNLNDENNSLATLKITEFECGVAGGFGDIEKDIIVNQFKKIGDINKGYSVASRRKYDQKLQQTILNEGLECANLLMKRKVKWCVDIADWDGLF